MQSVIDTIKNFFSTLFSFITDIAASMKDLIADFFLILLDGALSMLMKFLDWLASYCAYCTGGGVGVNGGSVSVFLAALVDALNSFSPCLLYLMNKSGIQGALQILACAMVIWSAFRVAALVRSIV